MYVPLDAEEAVLRIEPILGNVHADGTVDVQDVQTVNLNWGPCPVRPPACTGEANGDGVVDVADLVIALLNWGASRVEAESAQLGRRS